MPHWRDLIPSRFLRAEDLTPGEDLTVTIAKIAKEPLKKLDGTEEIRGTLYFEEIEKVAPVNVINSATIEAITGESDWEKWIGHKVTFYRTTCNFRGNPRCPCIRIRDTAPVPAETAAK